MDFEESKLNRHTQAWIKNKLGILSGKTGHQQIKSLLSKFSPDSGSVKFTDKGISAFEKGSEQEKFMHGFQLEATLSSSQADLLKHSIQGKGNLFPFPASISLKKNSNGSVNMKLTTTGDYAQAIMKNPRYVAGINVEAYARYALFRGVSQYLARSAVYQFNPDGPKPKNADPKHPNIKDQNDFLLLTKNTFLPKEQSIEQLLDDNLTKRDREKLGEDFEKGMEYPLELREKRERYEALKIELQATPENRRENDHQMPKPSSPSPALR